MKGMLLPGFSGYILVFRLSDKAIIKAEELFYKLGV